MKIFKDTTTQSNLLVFVFFLVMTVVAIIFSGCDNNETNKIIIKNKDVIDSTSGNGENLYDSVYFNNLKYIDSLKTKVN